MGRKANANQTAPLCSDDECSGYIGCHSKFDAGKQSFARATGFDREEACRITDEQWQAHCATRMESR